ncbi:MAG: GNAT family N-acetyltransferase [Myxococcota bacterium]
MKIRGFAKADFDYVVSVLDRWWDGPAGARALPVFFYELGRDALIAEDEDEVIGFLLGFLTPDEPPVGYIHLVGIHPDHRRRGVGHLLYQQFEERCREGKAEGLRAITTVGNEGSVAFHRAEGFEATEVPNYAGPGRPRVLFTKKLLRS